MNSHAAHLLQCEFTYYLCRGASRDDPHYLPHFCKVAVLKSLVYQLPLKSIIMYVDTDAFLNLDTAIAGFQRILATLRSSGLIWQRYHGNGTISAPDIITAPTRNCGRNGHCSSDLTVGNLHCTCTMIWTVSEASRLVADRWFRATISDPTSSEPGCFDQNSFNRIAASAPGTIAALLSSLFLERNYIYGEGKCDQRMFIRNDAILNGALPNLVLPASYLVLHRVKRSAFFRRPPEDPRTLDDRTQYLNLTEAIAPLLQ